ncbi:inosine-5'-monophosphate dehydrogenase 2-like [Pyrus ussuriensis x Pyrus communis]|uniref:Inosine-5'-monophosphate dehydrogenase 2-like n=1 Tax=Pyrus ussuriensis x Pyrus communis TaxID=2448454 RepID=A0A5N5FKX1_9ROSA|nr:inosine-5'-monophosphate dehydrogenase 2-like [Pyrus ussuriensis x Pyrus communis]
MEALMATNKMPENRLRPKLSLLERPGSSLTGSPLLRILNWRYQMQNGTRKSSQFPKIAVTSRNEKS